MNLLFVCTANICRSAYAELMTRHLLGEDTPVVVGSAGTHGYVDHRLDPPMAQRLRDRGVDPDGFRSRRLTPRLVADADLVLTAETLHRRHILEERPEAFRRVLTLGQLARALDDADVGPDGPVRGPVLGPVRGPELLAELGALIRPPDPAHDVLDPYRRGEEAADRAAEHLDALVRRILPVLG